MTERSAIIDSFRAYGNKLAEELGGLVGSPVRFDEAIRYAVVEAESLSRGSDPIVYTSCTPKDDSGRSLYYLCSREHAVEWAGCLRDLPPEQIEAKAKEPLDPEIADAYGEVMDLAVAVFERVSQGFEKSADVPGFAREELTEILSPAENAIPVQAGSYQQVCFEFGVADKVAVIEMYLPVAAAEDWLGGTIRSDEPSQPVGKDAPTRSGPILLVDPSEEDRKAFEAMQGDLGRRVWAVDPSDFGRAMLDEIADAGGVILAWNLGVCGGMDAFDLLRSCESTDQIPVALASDNPTRSRVLRAMRKGAQTFLKKPYLASEIAERFLGTEIGIETGSAPRSEEDRAGDSAPSSAPEGAPEAAETEAAAPESPPDA